MTDRILLIYTDPGTGAMLWQLLAAAVIGVAFYFRHYMVRIKELFSDKSSKK